uniref:Uncharacterized protein n=1 Tax=Anguilla anguilla TaxID=7936 RepID=A0A0E9SWE0_ANGAN
MALTQQLGCYLFVIFIIQSDINPAFLISINHCIHFVLCFFFFFSGLVIDNLHVF